VTIVVFEIKDALDRNRLRVVRPPQFGGLSSFIDEMPVAYFRHQLVSRASLTKSLSGKSGVCIARI